MHHKGIKKIERIKMDLSNLKKIKKKKKKRVGRGYSSGKGGHTVGRGAKGQKARNTVSLGFEGGQTPLYKRLPKIGGFKSRKNSQAIIKVEDLNEFRKGSTVTPEDLVKKGFFKTIPPEGVKILAGGKLKKELTFSGFDYSKGAKKLIEKSGSKIKK